MFYYSSDRMKVLSHSAARTVNNAPGEPVASRVYFYQLQADNASHPRKMLILK